MNLGIYGCSFAHELSANRRNIPGKSWSKILTDNYQHNIKNFAMSGSSVYYSYMKFKETHEQFDKVIFLATLSDRLYCPNFSWQHVSSALLHDNFTLPVKEKKILESYFSHLHNSQEKDDMRELIINEVQRLRASDLLLIDSAKTLIHIGDLDTANINIVSRFKESIFPDPRYCHMNDKNNATLAEKINNWINGNEFVFNIHDFSKASLEEIKNYFKPENRDPTYR
jgi:hypothetical protein